jgi:hypothetical protein
MRRKLRTLPGEISPVRAGEKSAEAIVAESRAGGWKKPVETVKPENSLL